MRKSLMVHNFSKVLPIDRYGAVFDAHVHTYFDFHDAVMSPRELVKATIKKGLNWVNAMAHDSLRGIKRVIKVAKEYKMPYIPAMEISTGINHILAYGVQEWDFAKDSWDPVIVIERLREQDCAIYLSHPFLNTSGAGKWTPDIVQRLDVDGIELVNGSAQIFNRITKKWFKNYPKGKIAGTDAHHPSQLGYTYTQVDVNSTDPDDLVRALQKGRVIPRGIYVPIFKFLLWTLGITIKKSLTQSFKIEGKSIIANTNKMGWEPSKDFSPEKWREFLLKKPVLTPFDFEL